MKPADVRCYSGRRYSERPVSFTVEGLTHRVRRVENEWLEPGKRHFVVCTENGELFDLCHDELTDEWLVT